MRLKQLELTGFKSFAKKTVFPFTAPITAIVGPNGSGKSNCAEAFRWVLGERSMKSLRGLRGEDLIFNGSGNSAKSSSAVVTLLLDNHDHQLNLDFDEVAISREVYRDGGAAYLINGSPVRQRDIYELLAPVALGSSDHCIVNQGDADQILRVNQFERRVMVENALGLRVYQWKIEESEKKLEKTEANVRQVESLRRELAPHLRFLKKQMEKIEQTAKLRQELKSLYLIYLRQEEKYLIRSREKLAQEKKKPLAELARVEQKLAEFSAKSETTDWEQEMTALTQKRDELSRQLGRLEGLMEIKEKVKEPEIPNFTLAEVDDFAQEINHQLDQAEKFSDIFSIKGALAKIRQFVDLFLSQKRAARKENEIDAEKLSSWRQEYDETIKALAQVAAQERASAARAAEARAAEREVYEWRAQRSEWLGQLNALGGQEEKLRLETENFEREIAAGVVLVDQEIKRFRELASEILADEDRIKQEERRRQLEHLKIKLEDQGLEAGDTIKEFKEASERDEFLTKEIADLTASALSLRQIIKELREKIDHDFKNGLEKINRQFQQFFELMFDGGSARLELVKEKKIITENEAENLLAETFSESDKNAEWGVEIAVNLPRKKIRRLEMLSGGERALVSIALLFAMSQVNPPPFLILDETDAALDEANSRKYGEMVVNLAKHSQLILITHNRETMSHAGVIYGITMGSDGVSRQLSIKFDEAAGYAK